ncbi:MAG: hypothetical protein QX194_05110 [Methylococcales bacterium]
MILTIDIGENNFLTLFFDSVKKLVVNYLIKVDSKNNSIFINRKILMKKRDIALVLLSTLSLAGVPTLSKADSCSEIKEQYWDCVRDAMNGGSCNSNISIPPECLTAGSAPSGGSSGSSSSYSPPPRASFFKKKEKPFVYQADLPAKKQVKVIDIKPANGKIYLETEEEVDEYLTRIRDDLTEAINDGKRVRLQFQ